MNTYVIFFQTISTIKICKDSYDSSFETVFLLLLLLLLRVSYNSQFLKSNQFHHAIQNNPNDNKNFLENFKDSTLSDAEPSQPSFTCSKSTI